MPGNFGGTAWPLRQTTHPQSLASRKAQVANEYRKFSEFEWLHLIQAYLLVLSYLTHKLTGT